MKMHRIMMTLVISTVMLSAGYGQEKPGNMPIENITGTVMGTDSVGNIISIRTDDQKQMVFSVPDKAVITQDTQKIGLMDIQESSAVTIQYFVSPSFKNTVISIVDNDAVINE